MSHRRPQPHRRAVVALTRTALLGPATAAAATDRLGDLPTRASPASSGAIVIAIALVVIAIAAVALRRRQVRRLLAARQARALVPSDALDPPVEAVLRFAAQLGRVRRRGRGRLERPSSAIRVRIASAPGGRLGYELHHPAHARAVIDAALGAYPDLDVHDLTPPPPSDTATEPEPDR